MVCPVFDMAPEPQAMAAQVSKGGRGKAPADPLALPMDQDAEEGAPVRHRNITVDLALDIRHGGLVTVRPGDGPRAVPSVVFERTDLAIAVGPVVNPHSLPLVVDKCACVTDSSRMCQRPGTVPPNHLVHLVEGRAVRQFARSWAVLETLNEKSLGAVAVLVRQHAGANDVPVLAGAGPGDRRCIVLGRQQSVEMTSGMVGDRHPASANDHVVPVSSCIAAQGGELVGIVPNGRRCGEHRMVRTSVPTFRNSIRACKSGVTVLDDQVVDDTRTGTLQGLARMWWN